MKQTVTLAAVIAALAVLVGCGGKPARIEHAVPPPIVTDGSPVPLRAVVVDQEGKQLSEGVAFSAVPAGAVTFTEDGRFSCTKSADVRITLSGGGLTKDIALQCRTVKRIQVMPSLELILDGPPMPLDAVLLDEGGLAVDLPVTYDVADPKIAAVQSGMISALSVGDTVVKARFDPLIAETKVRVVAKAGAEDIDIEADASYAKTLGQGRYVIDVVVDQPVALIWANDSCPPQKAKKKHHVECRVGEHGTLRIESAGLAAKGKLTLRVVP